LAWMSSKVFKNKDNLMENYRSTSLAKIPGVVNYVTKLLEVQDKFLVFAHHLQLLDAISQALQTKVRSLANRKHKLFSCGSVKT
jgi:SWI/SNF-related matrix-associated actin-dependent regulator 1 of chromatin subfamily A